MEKKMVEDKDAEEILKKIKEIVKRKDLREFRDGERGKRKRRKKWWDEECRKKKRRLGRMLRDWGREGRDEKYLVDEK